MMHNTNSLHPLHQQQSQQSEMRKMAETALNYGRVNYEAINQDAALLTCLISRKFSMLW